MNQHHAFKVLRMGPETHWVQNHPPPMLGFVCTYHVFIMIAVVLESAGLWLKAWVLEPDWLCPGTLAY